MTTGEQVTAIVVFALAGVLLLLGIRSFLQKGFLLNNAWIYASKEERKAMNRKPYYRQTAVVFGLLAAVFLVIGFSLVFRNDRLFLLEIPLTVGTIVYAAVSTARIRREERSRCK